MTLFRQIELPTDLPISLAFQMDRRALVFSFVVAVASAVLFGLVPAIQATRTDLTAVMKAERQRRARPPAALGTRGARRRTGRRRRSSLLVVAMFMYRGFRQQLASGPGYRTDHLLMMSFDPSLVRYTDAQSQQFFRAGRRARARRCPASTPSR